MQKSTSQNIFVNEDISKPENRLNLALFHLQMDDAFHAWFCGKLGLDTGALFYPTENLQGDRPDFAVEHKGKIIGYVELELGDENMAQLQRYRGNYESTGIKVYSITGSRHHHSDLGLDEIAQWLQSNKFSNPQKHLSAQYACRLIDTFANGKGSNTRSQVSDTMKEHPFVSALLTLLQDVQPNASHTRPYPGSYYCDTVGEKGFSLRVSSPKSTSKSLSLLSISGGRNQVTFLSATKYRKYLGHKPQASVDDWISFLEQRLNLPISRMTETERCNQSIDAVMKHLDELARLVKTLV